MQTRKYYCGNILSYQCFVIFPCVGKPEAISEIRNISLQEYWILHWHSSHVLSGNNDSRARNVWGAMKHIACAIAFNLLESIFAS